MRNAALRKAKLTFEKKLASNIRNDYEVLGD